MKGSKVQHDHFSYISAHQHLRIVEIQNQIVDELFQNYRTAAKPLQKS